MTKRSGPSSLICAICIFAACGLVAGCDGEPSGERPRAQGGPLRLHPDNRRYLEVGGRPTVLITAGEHYGAVVNADFAFGPYFDELDRHGFNLTRLFSGSYVESEASFGIGERNTLAPPPGRTILPWTRTDERGPDGIGKLDLESWNRAYFKRLRRFVAEAQRRGIVVELVLFSALYEFHRWEASPFNARNNVNEIGAIDVRQLYTLDNGNVLQAQDALVRKLVTELRSFDNVYYEVINEGFEEPAFAADDWQDHVIETIEEAEAAFPQAQRHLIARNYDHETGPIENPNPSVSIFNFHYQRDVSQYRDLDGVLAFDETGFQGTGDRPYRTDAWIFMLSGGGVYSHLDYSFAVGAEDGSSEPPPTTPGGGSPALRRSLGVLKEFLEGFDFARMAPRPGIVKSAPAGATTRALADPGRAYAVYVAGGSGPLAIDLAAGRYQVDWIDTGNGVVQMAEPVSHSGGVRKLIPPLYEHDIALSIKRTD